MNLTPQLIHRSKNMSFNEFAERAKAHVRGQWRDVTHPEGDAQPGFYTYVAPSGALIHMPLAYEWFSSRGEKDELAARMAFMARVPGVSMVAWSCTVWHVLRTFTDEQEYERAIETNEMPAGEPMPSEHPDRTECAQVIALDPEITKAWWATISRGRRRPPRVAAWDEPHRDMIHAGLMIEPLREALR